MKRIIIAAVVVVAVAVAGFFIAISSTGSATANGSGWTQLNGGSSLYNYPSVAFTCRGTDGVYVSSFANVGASAGGGVFVVKDDSACLR